MFVEIAEAVSLSKTLYEERNALASAWRKLINRIKRGKLQLVIFGPGGVGKTTLGQMMSGQWNAGLAPARYDISTAVEEYRLPGDFVCKILVPPGQLRHRDYTWPELFRSLSEGKSTGIINLVANGFHSLEVESFRETEDFQAGMDARTFFQHYAVVKREKEIAVLRELSPHLAVAPKKLWMITLATKQDLWWTNRHAVKAHYTAGEYRKIIDELAHKRGEQNFRHEYLSASLVLSNLVTDSNELLAQTTQGYDQNLQYAHLKKLLDTINGLVAGS